MLVLSLRLEKAGHEAVTAWTFPAPDIHDYQRRGPGPDMVLWKSRGREEAAARRGCGETRRGRGGVKWTNEMEKGLEWVKGALARAPMDAASGGLDLEGGTKPSQTLLCVNVFIEVRRGFCG
jgi:PaREP1